jgi:hypothetical protein
MGGDGSEPVLLDAEEAKLYFVRGGLLRVQLEAVALEILDFIGFPVVGGKLAERLAEREAELGKATIAVPVLQDFAGDGVARLREPHFALAIGVGGPGNAQEGSIVSVAYFTGRGVNRPSPLDQARSEEAKQNVVGWRVFRVCLEAGTLEPLRLVSLAVGKGKLGTPLRDREAIHIDARLLAPLTRPYFQETPCDGEAVEGARVGLRGVGRVGGREAH